MTYITPSDFLKLLVSDSNDSLIKEKSVSSLLTELSLINNLLPQELIDSLSDVLQVNEIEFSDDMVAYLPRLSKTVFGVSENQIIPAHHLNDLSGSSNSKNIRIYFLSSLAPKSKLSKKQFLDVFMKTRWNVILILLIISIPPVIFSALSELLQQPLFDEFIPQGNIPIILLVGVASIMLQLTGQVINTMSSLVQLYFTNNIDLETKITTAKRFLDAQLSALPERDAGSWRMSFSVASAFIESIQSVCISIPIAVISLAANLLIIGAFTDLSAIWHLFLLMLIPTFFSAILSYIGSNLYIKLIGQQGSIESIIFEVVKNIRGIWLLNSTQIYINKFTRSRSQMSDNMLKAGNLQAISSFINSLFQGLLYAFIYYQFYRSVQSSSSSELSVGTLLVMYFAVGSISGSLDSISMDIVSIAQSLPTYWTPNPIRDVNSFRKIKYYDEKCPSQIVFSNIVFNYKDQRLPFPEPLNFLIENNSSYALIGPSGAGKSTLLNIMLGYIKPLEGKLEIFDQFSQKLNIDITECNTLVLGQDTNLYGSILHDILDPNRQFSLNDLENAISKLNLSEVLDSLPLRWKTPINEFNRDLSLGQLQRFKLARALLKRYDIIISDEITCHLPEDQHLDAINLLNRNSMIHISSLHRVSALHLFDYVICLDGQGKINLQKSSETNV